MLRRVTTFELDLEELQTQLSRIDRRTAQHTEELESSIYNAHFRVSDLQSELRAQDLAAADLQNAITQATTNTRQLRLHLGNALQVMGSRIAAGNDPR